MNIYFMLGSLAGNILDIAGVGGLLSGLLLRRFQFTYSDAWPPRSWTLALSRLSVPETITWKSRLARR
jgi:hypothetical protein